MKMDSALRSNMNKRSHFLDVKNAVGLTALCNPFISAMSVVKRLFMYLIYYATLKNVF